MKHMIIVDGAKIRRGLAHGAAAVFLLAGLAVGAMAAKAWFADAIAQGVTQSDREDFPTRCLDYATQNGLSVDACAAFIVPDESPQVSPVDNSDLVPRYDSFADGTLILLADGTLIYVPTDPTLCPQVTLVNETEGTCAVWRGMGGAGDGSQGG